MFTLRNSENIVLLIITVLWVIPLIKHTLKDLRKKRLIFAEEKMLGRIAGHKPTQRPAYKALMIFTAFALLGVGLLRPQGELFEEQVSGSGLDLVVAMDISKSMLANDIDGNTRLEVAKAIVKHMVQGLKNDRLGLVVFAGETMVQSPISYDKNAFLTFLDRINPNLLAKQGTNLAGAIQTSLDRFDMTASQSKVILLISDGEDQNHEELDGAIKEAAKKNIPVFTLGIGSREGGRIPESRGWFGEINYKRYKGQVIVSKLDEKVLKKIAKETNASYYRASDVSGARNVIESLNGIERVVVNGGTKMTQKELYYFPVFMAFFLLLFEWVLSERIHYEREKDHWLKRL
ncbi:MAG: von Willebrand factor type A domain protein [bacterium ADurb.Bin157]|nr:VWA domain-containing protein [Candidatus Riflebacteria bacterium]MDD2623995.1 VWA domain-containing protein [Candidatus Riflebacteria bacterium]MDD3377322.1 VWA domain-containing protein [Candidatus Riflebacteria bacterium]OQB46483.1 MAG: von Willebrand factor type A domain protein [bacterium ADurb.Bin157]